MDWDYFDKFNGITEKYLPSYGEGETMATQIVTAVCKLVYKWYNDGDVFDNMHYLSGWCNDLSSYANWLRKYADAAYILDNIDTIVFEHEYEQLLADLADSKLVEEYLDEMSKKEKIGSIYKCDGPYKFEDSWEEDEVEEEEGAW